jgi:expansin (peptidoglycan-binding protein)
LHCTEFLFLAAGGKSVTVRVQDKCVTCAEFNLDMSPAAFNALADPLVGRLHGVTWNLY